MNFKDESELKDRLLELLGLDENELVFFIELQDMVPFKLTNDLRTEIVNFIDRSGGDTYCSDDWSDDQCVRGLLTHAKWMWEREYEATKALAILRERVLDVQITTVDRINRTMQDLRDPIDAAVLNLLRLELEDLIRWIKGRKYHA